MVSSDPIARDGIFLGDILHGIMFGLSAKTHPLNPGLTVENPHTNIKIYPVDFQRFVLKGKLGTSHQQFSIDIVCTYTRVLSNNPYC
jgi:hypothetical protein